MPSSSSSHSSSSPSTTPNLTIRKYFTLLPTARACQQCSHTFSLSTGNDNLKYHMHAVHKSFARDMGIDLPSSQREKPPSTQSILASSSALARPHIAIDVDDDYPPSELHPLSPPSISAHSPSSSASTHSSSSSVVSLLPSMNKRVSLMPPPEPRRVKRKPSQHSTAQSRRRDARLELRRRAGRRSAPTPSWYIARHPRPASGYRFTGPKGKRAADGSHHSAAEDPSDGHDKDDQGAHIACVRIGRGGAGLIQNRSSLLSNLSTQLRHPHLSKEVPVLDT